MIISRSEKPHYPILFLISAHLCLVACGDDGGNPIDPTTEGIADPTVTEDPIDTGGEDSDSGDSAGLVLSQLGPELLVYSAKRDGDYDIFVALPDGSLELSLTQGSSQDTSPSVSSDGSALIYVSDRSGTSDIWMASAEGDHHVLFGERTGTEVGPRWSPDGDQIAFLSTDGATWDLYRWTFGATPVNLTDGSASVRAWSWAPEGQRIAYQSTEGGISHIQVIDLSSEETFDLGPGIHPAWSPDGATLVFASNREGSFHLWLSNVDGTDQRSLTNNTGQDYHPAWSPDGSTIAFMSDSSRSTFFDIMATSVDGRQQWTLLETGLLQAQSILWSPMGNTLSYATFDFESQERLLHLLDIETQEVIQLGLVESFQWVRTSD